MCKEFGDHLPATFPQDPVTPVKVRVMLMRVDTGWPGVWRAVGVMAAQNATFTPTCANACHINWCLKIFMKLVNKISPLHPWVIVGKVTEEGNKGQLILNTKPTCCSNLQYYANRDGSSILIFSSLKTCVDMVYIVDLPYK